MPSNRVEALLRAERKPALPVGHRCAARKPIECAGGWWILAHDREAGDYYEAYKRSATPVQLLRRVRSGAVLSLLTPCVQTEGKFELAAGGKVQRFCCYRCACHCARQEFDVELPPSSAWTVYMLLDAVGYIENPGAPVEPAHRDRKNRGNA